MGLLGIVGIGHIGGSIAKACLGTREILVSDIDRSAMAAAQADGCRTVDDISQLADCGLVIVAAPPNAAKQLIRKVLEVNVSGVVTDTCGVRSPIQAAVEDSRRFIGGHPMAGNEGSGYASADPAIFRGAKWVLTPSASASAEALAAVCDFVAAIGAEPLLTDAATHDRAIAQVSHLPHVLANALLRGLENDEVRLASGSFRGATRVGGSNPELWAELWTLNREHLLPRLDAFMADLGEFRRRLTLAEKADLAAWVLEATS